MQYLWCWRCKSEMPMLEEDEYAVAWSLYGDGMRATKAVREHGSHWVQNAPSKEERFRPLLAWYEKLTGFHETNNNAIMHHRLALYGPPCQRCGKPLRSPQAKLCGACMFPVAKS